MKCVPPSEAHIWLRQIGMKLDDWNRIVGIANPLKVSRLAYQAPRDALELLSFSRHAVEWLPKGDWWLLQFDNSSTFDLNSASLFSAFLMEGQRTIDLAENRAFLFELGNGGWEDRVALQVSNLIFSLLMFEGHASIVSSGSNHGQMLSLQDGFAYLETGEQNELRARTLVANFERNPMGFPSWLNEMVARYQESGH